MIVPAANQAIITFEMTTGALVCAILAIAIVFLGLLGAVIYLSCPRFCRAVFSILLAILKCLCWPLRIFKKRETLIGK